MSYNPFSLFSSFLFLLFSFSALLFFSHKIPGSKGNFRGPLQSSPFKSGAQPWPQTHFGLLKCISWHYELNGCVYCWFVKWKNSPVYNFPKLSTKHSASPANGIDALVGCLIHRCHYYVVISIIGYTLVSTIRL